MTCVNANSFGTRTIAPILTYGGQVLDPAKPLAGYRILVVEDEYLIAMDLKRWLTAAGAIVVGPVPGVRKALDLIEDDVLAAAVLDVSLGNGDTSYPIAAELDARGGPFLFATGDVTLPKENGYGGHPRLTKPYLAPDLVQAVAKLIAGSTSGS